MFIDLEIYYKFNRIHENEINCQYKPNPYVQWHRRIYLAQRSKLGPGIALDEIGWTYILSKTHKFWQFDSLQKLILQMNRGQNLFQKWPFSLAPNRMALNLDTSTPIARRWMHIGTLAQPPIRGDTTFSVSWRGNEVFKFSAIWFGAEQKGHF